MRHIDDGLLRRMVDEPFAASDSLREHYQTCTRCQTAYATIAETARAAAAALAVRDGRPDPAVALAQVQRRLARAQPVRRWRVGLAAPWARRAGGLVGTVALLAGLLTWSPAGTWAQDLITVFQPAQVAPVSVTTADLRSLAGLARYGTVSAPATGDMRTVPSAAEAAAAIDMPLAAPASLPGSIQGPPRYEVTSRTTISFTFRAAKARAAIGASMPPMPASIDGSTLRVTIQPAVATIYGGGSTGRAYMIVGQMRAPTVTSTGISVRELENYLLSLPDVPPAVAVQIRALQDPTSTLPIPIPVDSARATSVTVQGVRGLAVGDNTGVASGVMWERDGVIYGVAGQLSQDDTLAVANSLR